MYGKDTTLNGGQDRFSNAGDQVHDNLIPSDATAGAETEVGPRMPWEQMFDAMSPPALAQSPSPSTATPPSAQALEAARSTSVQVGSGSGVIVGRESDDYYVLTNAHVVGFFNKNEELVMPDGATARGRVVESNNPIAGAESDLAVVKVNAPGKNYTVAQWGADEPAAATPAVQTGFPHEDPAGSGTLSDHGRGLQYVGAVVTEDLQTASNAGRRLPGSYEVGLSGDLTSGSSGGGTFDEQGRLIGINGYGVQIRTPAAQEGGNVELSSPDTQAVIIDAQTSRDFIKGVVPGF